MRITCIPAIDLLGGKVVRLYQGDYDQVQEYEKDPLSLAQYFESLGAKRLHIVDLDAAKTGDLVNHPLIHEICDATNLSIDIGGGIRNLDVASKCLDTGIDFVVLGSVLAKDIKAADQIIREYPGKVIAGLDLKGRDIATDGWTQVAATPLGEMIEFLNDSDIASVICTDIQKDGTLAGPNLELLNEMAGQLRAPVVASGGVGSYADVEALDALYDEGVTAYISGKAILDGRLDITTLF